MQYKLLSPKFKYVIFLVEQSKLKSNQTSCFADSYEVKEGSITFFQTAAFDDDKKFKIPVLTYPEGKWEACVLSDDFGGYPVFSQQGQSKSFVQPKRDEQTHGDDFDEVQSVSDEGGRQARQQSFPASMPGVSGQGNAVEFKKAKNEFVERHVKEFVKNESSFSVPGFLKYLTQFPESKQFKVSESDAVWTAAGLIRDKMVLTRKFEDPQLQKHLALILPDVMRRHWNGKMGPILQTIQEREETKNANAIDLAVWMVQNKFD